MLVTSEAGQSRLGLAAQACPALIGLAQTQSHGPDATGINDKPLLG